MSYSLLPWDLEERVEDAFVSLIKANVSRLGTVISARSVSVVKYPLVVVDAGESDNESADAQFNANRRLTVTIAISTECVNQPDILGQQEAFETARETHRAVKSSVIAALATESLQDDLNALGPQGVAFSLAVMTSQTRDAGQGLYTTEQTVEVICNPKEI